MDPGSSLTFIIWEVILHGADRELLLKSIDLVQEQNDASLDEPPRIADAVEKSEGFLHTVHSLVFKQQLIILGYGDQEEDGGHVLEAMDPLLPF